MFHVVLVEPEIPPNTGNVARLCVATGATLHLVRPLGFAINDRTLKRAGLDYWEHLSLVYHDSLEMFLSYAQGKRLWFATTKTSRRYIDVNFQEDDFLIFGKETAGLPADLLAAHAESMITIPQWGPVRSLNLSNSVAIVLYEAMRQTQ